MYKDIATLMKQMKFYLLMMVAFALIPGQRMMIFALAYSSILPFTAMAYDAQSKWDRLAAMLPYTDAQLVLSKYILGWAGVLGVTLISLLARIVAALVRDAQAELAFGLQALVLGAALVLTLLAVSLPLLYRFGVERGRMIFLLVSVAGPACVFFLADGVVDKLGQVAAGTITIAAVAIAVAANLASVSISSKLHRRYGAV